MDTRHRRSPHRDIWTGHNLSGGVCIAKRCARAAPPRPPGPAPAPSRPPHGVCTLLGYCKPSYRARKPSSQKALAMSDLVSRRIGVLEICIVRRGIGRTPPRCRARREPRAAPHMFQSARRRARAHAPYTGGCFKRRHQLYRPLLILND